MLFLSRRCVLLVDHDITGTWHVVLVEALDVQAHVVTWVGKVDARVMHLHCEHLACARIRGCVCWQEDHLLARLHNALLHTACKDVTHTLNLVNTRDWHAHGGTRWSLRHTEEVVEHVVQSVNMNRLLANDDIHALPPSHVVGLLQEVVTHPARDWHHRCIFLNKIFLPANLDQRALHLIADLIVTSLLVARNITVHLVDTNTDLLDTQQVDQARMLSCLALDLTCFVVALRDSSREITITWHHDQGAISLRSTGDHILNEVSMTWSINDVIVHQRCDMNHLCDLCQAFLLRVRLSSSMF